MTGSVVACEQALARSRALARLVSLAQIGELAPGLVPSYPGRFYTKNALSV